MSTSLIFFVGCVGLSALPPKDGASDDTGGSTLLGALQIDRNSLDFGDVAIGSSAEQALTLTNTGDGAVAVELALSGYGFELSVGVLRVATEEVVTITLSPTDAGDYEGTLDLTVNATDTLALPLTGVGIAEGDADTDTDTDADTDTGPQGDVSVTPTTYDFGNVDVDGDDIKTFTVSNNGDADLVISDVTSSAAVWTWDGTLSPPITLSPGSNRLLEVTFAPTAATTYAGDVTIHSDDPDSPELEISLTGEGIDACDICSPLIEVETGSDPYAIGDFFSVSAFGMADERTITIENIGDEDLEVSNVSVSNDPITTCGEFTVGGWGSSETLRPYDTTTFTISYLATDLCAEAANLALDWNILHILSNDPSQGDWQIELGGAGI